MWLVPIGLVTLTLAIPVSILLERGMVFIRSNLHHLVDAAHSVQWAASTLLFGCDQFAVPFKAELCTPAESFTVSVAGFAPAACAVSGLNCTSMLQFAPGAKVVPQVDSSPTML